LKPSLISFKIGGDGAVAAVL